MRNRTGPEYRKKANESQNMYRSQNRAKFNELTRKANARVKLLVFGHYSPFLMCARCGCTDMRVLTIDHIEGGGRAHRRAISKHTGGSRMYWWLRRNGYPLGFQVLCMNCNWIKRTEREEWKHV